MTTCFCEEILRPHTQDFLEFLEVNALLSLTAMLQYSRSSGRPKPNKTEGSAELFGRIIRPNLHSVFVEYSAEAF